MCIPAHALVSGLLLRIEREGHVPSQGELSALIALGLSRPDLRRMLSERGGAGEAFARAIEVLDEMP